jgi:hypothetical protein
MQVVSEIKECIIIGGGKSIADADQSALKVILQDKFVIAVNYAFKYFPHTLLCFIDKKFYYSTDNENPNIYEELRQEPLIIGINHDTDKVKLPNTILLKENGTYQREKAPHNGWYPDGLSGVFALTLSSYLMNYEGTIYLLGFDWSRRKDIPKRDDPNYNSKTSESIHFYSDIKHRGCGYVSYYENHNPDNMFKFFSNEPKLRIYNVSPNSNIENFEKINYPTMFNLMNTVGYNQNELRQLIISKLNSAI